MKHLAIKIGFLGKFLQELKWWYKVQWFKKSLQRRGRNPTVQTLGDKSRDSTKEVLGQCSLGTVLGQCSLGTVLGQYSLGTVLGQSWDCSHGRVVLGQ